MYIGNSLQMDHLKQGSTPGTPSCLISQPAAEAGDNPIWLGSPKAWLTFNPWHHPLNNTLNATCCSLWGCQVSLRIKVLPTRLQSQSLWATGGEVRRTERQTDQQRERGFDSFIPHLCTLLPDLCSAWLRKSFSPLNGATLLCKCYICTNGRNQNSSNYSWPWRSLSSCLISWRVESPLMKE